MSIKITLLFLAIFSIVEISLCLKTHPTDLLFQKWMSKYNKTYTAFEYELRHKNFLASLERVALKNKRSHGTVYGLNKFSDMSPVEFQNTILMKKTIPRSGTRPLSKPNRTPSPVGLPATFDWRENGAVTAVKDQGQCGSCWAFSVTENVESVWILGGKSTNSTLNLSPQQIVDCDTTDLGCEGGDSTTAFDYLISAGGQEPISQYPYTAMDGNCKFKSQYVQAKISNWQYATEFWQEDEMQTNLVAWAPLSVCLDASQWQDYTSGVMTWEECDWIPVLDHCVQLVGYDDTASDPYWIVRNSWGTDWGINGYIYIEKGYDACGIAREATCAVL